MTDYMQRKSNLEEFKNPILVSFKTNLISKFHDLVDKDMKNIGAHYFSHSLIKNHRQADHTISSFMTHVDWQEKYWKDYWDCDPIHSASYPIAQVNGNSVVSWRVIDSESDCMENRKMMCQVSNGLRFDIQYNDHVLESFSFGWKKHDMNQMSRQKLAKLSDIIAEFRAVHFKTVKDKDGFF